MSTTLFGKFIANTYQKVLQYDENENYTTIANFDIADLLDSKYTLLNGAGQAVPGIAIDHTGQGNGGLFIKETDIDPSGAWGLQQYYGNGAGPDTEPGIQFWRPYEGNYPLFLKNTGTLFVGYKGETSVTTDVPNYNLYVKDGIYITGSNPGIMANEDNFNFLMNPSSGSPYHPFIIRRYSIQISGTLVVEKNLVFSFGGTNISTSEWTALVVGFNYDNANNQEVDNFICCCFKDSGIWKIRVGNDGGSGSPIQNWNVDVLYIRNGFFDDGVRENFGPTYDIVL
jgi:hypothetical protein